MKIKTCIFTILFFFSCFLYGCSFEENMAYSQETIFEPNRIDVTRMSDFETISYDTSEDKYKLLYNTLEKNWWRTTNEKLGIADDSQLTPVKSLKNLRTSTNKRYSMGNEIYIDFIYENSPLQWTRSNGQIIDIRLVRFVLPEHAEENKNVLGHIIVYENIDGNHEGFYKYYFDENVFNILSDNQNKVSSIYIETPQKYDLSYYSNITNEKMLDTFFQNYAWTQLIDHTVYRNSNLNSVVLNYVFSKKASKKDISSARDYWKSIGLYRSIQVSSNPDVYSLWTRIPKDSEVVIQVFVENTLISQDIYGNIERGIIYEETHYTNDI